MKLTCHPSTLSNLVDVNKNPVGERNVARMLKLY